ncbi:MAG: stage III sporulation protein AF [Lachnospiraceae bacterium]
MLDSFENWLERAVYLYLLFHIFSQLAAKEMYARYLRFFGSLCFLLFLLSPLFSIQKSGESLLDVLDQTTCQQELEAYQKDMQKMEYMQGTYYTKQYEKTLAEEVKKQAEKQGYEVQDVAVTLDEKYEISRIAMTLAKKEEKGALTETYRTQQREKLRTFLSNAFEVEKEVIQIA